MRKAFIELLRGELASRDDLILLLGDISVAGFLNDNDELISGVHNCGILEQAMVSFGAGVSAEGIYPVIQTIVPFLVERAFEQLKLDFSAQNNSGLFVGVGGGLEYSKLGYTHQTLWDTALLVNLPGVTLFTPTLGAEEVKDALKYFIDNKVFAYARLTKSYFQCQRAQYDGPFRLIKVNGTHVSSVEKATVICGAFPGIDDIVYSGSSDVFLYSYPNCIPQNVEILNTYRHIDIWEFGTSKILVQTLSQALPDVTISGKVQAPTFFRAYGDDEAKKFIATNWT